MAKKKAVSKVEGVPTGAPLDNGQLHIPVYCADVPDGAYQSRALQVNHLSGKQRHNLARMRHGLRAKEAELLSGRIIKTNADVIRYLLEQL